MKLLRDNLDEESKKEIEGFAQWLLNLGDGNLEYLAMENDGDSNYIPLPTNLLVPLMNDPIQDMISTVYDRFDKYYTNPEYLRQRAIVTPYNETVDIINAHALDLILGMTKTYFSSDSISQASDKILDHQLLYPTEFLNSLKFFGIPDHLFHLKVGAIIMLLRNIDQNFG